MKKMLFRDALMLFLIFTAPVQFLCAQNSQSPQSIQPNSVTPIQTLVEGNNSFGFDLFQQLGQSVPNDKNLVFSPYSISTALAMAWTGARNSTEAQMAKVLHISGDRVSVGKAFHQLSDGLEAAGKDGGFNLNIANSLWLEKNYILRQSFLDGLADDFNAPPNQVDFIKEPEPSRLKINQWVEIKTNNKIKDLIPLGAFNSETFMVLVNAIYFKADWLNAFKSENTKQNPFHLSADNSAQVSMMQQKKTFQIAEDNQAQVLELPYKGNLLSMVVILPRKEQGLADMEQKLDSDVLNTWLSEMSKQLVDVNLPKFKITFGTVELSPFLIDMGMPEAFHLGRADFTGMAKIDSKNLHIYIQKIFHKAYVTVDEKGTEAAGSTAVIMGAHPLCMMNPPTQKIILFNANHPFLFLIRDNQTKNILFIGRVADPLDEN